MEKEMATHSSALAWRVPWSEEPGGLQSVGLQKSDMTDRSMHTMPACSHNYELCSSFSMQLLK